MKTAKEIRASAREALKGKWGLAIGVGLVSAMFGGGGGGSLNLNFGGSSDTTVDTETVDKLAEVIAEYLPIFLTMFIVGFFIGSVIAIAWSILGSTINVGHCRFNLALVDGKPVSFGMLFSYFPHFWKAFLTHLLMNIYIFLWTLLFIIPGIIAAYSYVLAPYIIAEHPEISAPEALRRSKELMRGNKWRFFRLELVFIGWWFLTIFTLGIGVLWVIPYSTAAYADFYREVSGTRPVVEVEGECESIDTPAETAEF